MFAILFSGMTLVISFLLIISKELPILLTGALLSSVIILGMMHGSKKM